MWYRYSEIGGWLGDRSKCAPHQISKILIWELPEWTATWLRKQTIISQDMQNMPLLRKTITNQACKTNHHSDKKHNSVQNDLPCQWCVENNFTDLCSWSTKRLGPPHRTIFQDKTSITELPRPFRCMEISKMVKLEIVELSNCKVHYQYESCYKIPSAYSTCQIQNFIYKSASKRQPTSIIHNAGPLHAGGNLRGRTQNSSIP